jgi:hypothetical protein
MTKFLFFPDFYVFENGASFWKRGGVWLLLIPLLRVAVKNVRISGAKS